MIITNKNQTEERHFVNISIENENDAYLSCADDFIHLFSRNKNKRKKKIATSTSSTIEQVKCDSMSN